MKKVSKVDVWGWWIRGYSIAQIQEILRVKIELWPGSLSNQHRDIYDGKFNIQPIK